MKIRTNHVSNSSTTSFCVIGTTVKIEELNDDIVEQLKKIGVEPYRDDSWDGVTLPVEFEEIKYDQGIGEVYIGIEVSGNTVEQINEKSEKFGSIIKVNAGSLGIYSWAWESR